MPHSVDSFELRSCTRSPKPTSQGFPCQALSHPCQSIPSVSKISISVSGPILLTGIILRSMHPPLEFGFSPNHRWRKTAGDGGISLSRLRCVSSGACGNQQSSISLSDTCWTRFFCSVRLFPLRLNTSCFNSCLLHPENESFCQRFSRAKEVVSSINFPRFSASRPSVD